MADLQLLKIMTPAARAALIVAAAVTAVPTVATLKTANESENTSTNIRRATKVGKKRKAIRKATNTNGTRNTATNFLNSYGLICVDYFLLKQ